MPPRDSTQSVGNFVKMPVAGLRSGPDRGVLRVKMHKEVNPWKNFIAGRSALWNRLPPFTRGIRKSVLYRDALTYRFALLLTWHTRPFVEYLEAQGLVITAVSPRAVLKEAYAAGVIQDAEAWTRFLSARRAASQFHDYETSEGIAGQICRDFFPLLQGLRRVYNDE